MPFALLPSPHTKVFVGAWQITESEQTLRQLLHPLFKTEKQKLLTKKSHKARIEFLAGRLAYRYVCQKFGLEATELLADHLGAPYAFGQLNTLQITLSHSGNQAVCAASANQKIGIDVQTHSPSIKRVANKFLAPAEQTMLTQPNDYTVAWALKEATYKALGIPGTSARRNIGIVQLQPHPHPYWQGIAPISVYGNSQAIGYYHNTNQHTLALVVIG